MAELSISDSTIRQAFGSATGAMMGRAADALSVVQRAQWTRAFREGGQPSRKWEPLNPPEGSYRKGGEPLRDTGRLQASGFVKERSADQRSARVVWASSAFYAPYHQDGFTTSGPNYIPLTLKGRRMHRTGANPADEGLVEGVDYIMAWKGVTVPARPLIDYSDPVNQQEVNEAIADAVAGD